MNEWAVWCGGVVMAGNVIASNEEEEEGLGLADPAQHSTLGHMVMPITIMTIAIAVELVIVPIEVCVCAVVHSQDHRFGTTNNSKSNSTKKLRQSSHN